MCWTSPGLRYVPIQTTLLFMLVLLLGVCRTFSCYPVPWIKLSGKSRRRWSVGQSVGGREGGRGGEGRGGEGRGGEGRPGQARPGEARPGLVTFVSVPCCRLWHISRKECLCVFQHVDFVTAIAFHPRVSVSSCKSPLGECPSPTE